MKELTAVPESPRHESIPGLGLDELKQSIDHAAHLLPAQGPIPVFIHHNTLHAFEHLPFHEGVKRGSRVFGCQPYMSEDRYRSELVRGRIRFEELAAVLREQLKEQADQPIINSTTRFTLRMAMLQYALRSGPPEELYWFMAETDALRVVRSDASFAARSQLISETRRWAMRDLRSHASDEATRDAFTSTGDKRMENWSTSDWESFALRALWRACCDGVKGLPRFTPPVALPTRHRNLLILAGGGDPDQPVNDLLIRFCAAYVDQGLANWELPRRDEGFLSAFSALYGKPEACLDPALRQAPAELARIEQSKMSALECIRESLSLLGVVDSEWDDYLAVTLLALPGWGGIIRFLEEREDRAVHPISQNSLVEFLAVRLVLDRVALASMAADSFGFTGSLRDLRDYLRNVIGPPVELTLEQRAFPVFQLAQVLEWTPEELFHLNPAEWAALVREIEEFNDVERRYVFHLGYERRFYSQTLDAVHLHCLHPHGEPARPRFQAVFCIDEREESIRRHLEEAAPDCVTLSIAGFFAVAMYYRGATDAHYVPLCPVVIRPEHWVVERVADQHVQEHARRAKARRVLGIASHRLHVASRTFALGAVLSAAIGVLATIPLVARTLWPRLTARIRRMFSGLVATPPATRLQIERDAAEPHPEGGGIGYSVDEMSRIAMRALGDLGLKHNFSRLVFIFGHGSTSMNNPHESAYDCGACGGARGGPNGRALSQILNDHRVRERLKDWDFQIPDDTHFVGCMHNTSNEEMTYFDTDRIPESHREEFDAIRSRIEDACNRNAHERSRRFESAPLTLSPAAARQHVEGRAEDLAQVRPELGHATNGICVIGRRQRTRGLYLDRRAFLNSYDPTQDDERSSVLTRILQAAMPVCGGINLEYYFSQTDNHGFGCGSKLPHNITSLVGVMDGAASDLRTGLPWQMVEIHEPVRLLFVIETTPDKILRIMDQNPGIGDPIRNGWVQLAVLDPESPAIQVFQNDAFHDYVPQATRLPRAATSVDWYRGWRDHLEFAVIGKPQTPETA